MTPEKEAILGVLLRLNRFLEFSLLPRIIPMPTKPEEKRASAAAVKSSDEPFKWESRPALKIY